MVYLLLISERKNESKIVTKCEKFSGSHVETQKELEFKTLDNP